MGIYSSLATCPGDGHYSVVPSLCGFHLGNKYISGCLSEDEHCRIHSCEPGNLCSVAENSNVVWIIPIVNRADDGLEVPDIGGGGGTGDLYQSHELELPNKSTLEELERLCLKHIHDKEVLSRTKAALSMAFGSRNKTLSLDAYGMKDNEGVSLEKLVEILRSVHDDGVDDKKLLLTPEGPRKYRGKQQHLPNKIVRVQNIYWCTGTSVSSLLTPLQHSTFHIHAILHTTNSATSSALLDPWISFRVHLTP